MHRWLTQGLQRRPRWDLFALLARLAAGAVFVGFGLGKFLRHESERDAFERYEIPFPDAATYLIGGLELIGGVALLLGLFVRPFAFLLACNMIGAIITAGRTEGGPVHLLLTPRCWRSPCSCCGRVAGPRPSMVAAPPDAQVQPDGRVGRYAPPPGRLCTENGQTQRRSAGRR